MAVSGGVSVVSVLQLADALDSLKAPVCPHRDDHSRAPRYSQERRDIVRFSWGQAFDSLARLRQTLSHVMSYRSPPKSLASHHSRKSPVHSECCLVRLWIRAGSSRSRDTATNILFAPRSIFSAGSSRSWSRGTLALDAPQRASLLAVRCLRMSVPLCSTQDSDFHVLR